MRYVAAYLLAALSGKDSPNAADIKKILESVGIEADDARLDKVFQFISSRTTTLVSQVNVIEFCFWHTNVVVY